MKSTLRSVGRSAINFILLGLICILYLSTSHPAAQSAMGRATLTPVYRGHAKDRIALQIAVDWNASALEAILETLRSRDLTVTFAVSGNWASENAELLRQIVQDGHEIATMGSRTELDGDTAWLKADLTDSITKINKACGVQPVLYYSGTREVTRSCRAAQSLSLTHVVCTVDLLSGRGNSSDILNRALENPFEGSIMLLQPTAAAEKALPSILEALEEKGLIVGTVSSVLSASQTG